MKKNSVHIPQFLIPAFLVALILIFSCDKKNDQGEGIIPNVYVNFTIFPYTIDFIAMGNYAYFNDHGYRGVIVYRMDQDIFYAYERTCPFDAGKDCAQVEVEVSNITVVDSCCMSVYSLLDGSPITGPSTLPLKRYRIQHNVGNGSITIINTP